jgi:hypothetical protein
MEPGFLDITDSNLQLWCGEQHLSSPGYALLAGKDYQFGRDARASARLQPRNINTRYWWQLSTEPLQPALGPARHSADLVHAHLKQLHEEAGKPAELLLAAPGSMHRDQLSLLLGIVQQCAFDVVGLVHRSVALASAYGGSGRHFHLEVQLHQALVTEMTAREGEMVLEGSLPLPGCGFLQLQERLVEIIAAGFIRQTRFDPRRKAATEQQLYDALPDTLRTLRLEGECNLEINGYRARVTRQELLAAGQRLFDGVSQAIGSQGSDCSLLVDPIAALLPGMAEQHPNMIELQRHDLQDALRTHLDRLVQRGQPLSFVTSLPCQTGTGVANTQATPTPEPTPEPAPEPPPPPATHLLNGSRAVPLVEGLALGRGWEWGAADPGWLLRGEGPPPRVNDADYRTGQRLGAGDRVAIDGEVDAVLIEVEE